MIIIMRWMKKLKGVLFGGSEDGSIMFREDFENLDQRDLRVDDRDDPVVC